MSMGVHKAVQLLLKLAKIIVQKTKTQKDDQVVDALIEAWDVLQTVVPNDILKQKRK